MKWPWQQAADEPAPLWLATRTIYELDNPQEARQAGVVLATIGDEQWRALAAVADWLRIREAETAMGKAARPEDVSFMAGRSEGMRRLLAKAHDLVTGSKRQGLEADVVRAASAFDDRRPVPINEL